MSEFEGEIAERANHAVYVRIQVGTRTVRLREDVYERVRAHTREDETFSEAIAERFERSWIRRS